MRYRLAPDVTLRLGTGGAFLVGRRPLRAIGVNGALRTLLGEFPDAELCVLPGSAGDALETLRRLGYVQRAEDAATGIVLPLVSVVIPVRDRAQELERCLTSLAAVDYPDDHLEVIVVDDGSRDESAAVAARHGARVVRSGGTGCGPATARNRGARVAQGDLLAFVDSDCTASRDWLTELVGAFQDPNVAAVGGRVDGRRAGTRVERYETAMSSLTLGTRERSAGAGQDTFYLPSCNLLVRRDAFLAAGGFREGQHVGEDVDLTWRLRDAGGTIRYLPRGRVFHEHRGRTWPFLRRRFDYGTSEALLQALHPRRRKRVVIPVDAGAALGLIAVAILGAWPAWAGAAAAVLLGTLAGRHRCGRRGLPLGFREILAARLRALNSLAYYLGYHLLRYYGLPLVMLVAVWPETGSLTVAMALWVGVWEYRIKRPPLGFGAFWLLYLLEHLAYGLGAFWGCVRRRKFASYCPEVRARADFSFG